jgi:hypothetical protein
MKGTFTYVLIALLFISCSATAQTAQWLRSDTVAYSLNPSMARQLLAQNGTKVFAARVRKYAANIGDMFFSSVIDCYNTNGQLQWSYSLGDSVAFHDMVADNNGNVYVAGSFLENLRLGTTDVLPNTGGGWNTNEFLICINGSGSLTWKRNLSVNHPNTTVSTLAIDKSGNCWYALADFFTSLIIKTTGSGADGQTYTLPNTKTLSSISFDPWDNMFIAGSTSIGTLTIANMTVTVPEQYMMFLARLTNLGQCSWIKLAHDATFQDPQVVALTDGDAYLGGRLMDTTKWGTITFSGPQWVSDIFLTHTDSSGNFDWGYEVPTTSTITGDFDRASSRFIDSDVDDNLYVMGTLRGTVKFGNGVIPSTSSVPSSDLAIVRFSTSGIAAWAKVASSNGSYPSAISVNNVDEVYFASSITGSFSMDSITANNGMGFAYVAGKIANMPNAITNLHAKDEVFAYPNPAADRLYFSHPLLQKQVSITDMSGRLIKTASATDQLLIRDLPAGVYSVVVTSGVSRQVSAFTIVKH